MTFDDYLAGHFPSDTTILHILIGEGVSREVFTRVYAEALKRSRRVVVLEHNRHSSDWADRDVTHFVTADEMRTMIEDTNRAYNAFLTYTGTLAGETDLARNILFVVD